MWPVVSRAPLVFAVNEACTLAHWDLRMLDLKSGISRLFSRMLVLWRKRKKNDLVSKPNNQCYSVTLVHVPLVVPFVPNPGVYIRQIYNVVDKDRHEVAHLNYDPFNQWQHNRVNETDWPSRITLRHMIGRLLKFK